MHEQEQECTETDQIAINIDTLDLFINKTT